MLDKIAMRLAGLLPRRLVYWAAVRLGAHATQGQHNDQEAPALTFVDALKRW
ncbi:hypothetical protein [Bradyrhizobium sp. SZCCHNS3053]|uniref:hypothetical protein n=1 Tax=Bradyrhizobium sp. SZCCHNS3053 TaxID=3057322 RepID=UPI0029167E4F|nr:hypothetical protein [Bradyrhizobium sp. SZCCHNS3053]